ncbi:MAG: rod shape-determining protein [Oscillospiraceae bacterium]|nr:rod shape-determining protein [Oscillospiraceae bacterium]
MLKLSRDLGIDLGTSNVVVYAEGKGIVLREPAVVAVDKSTGKVLQVGAAARNMMGRTPGNVVAVHPLQGGVISDYDLTQKMMTEFLKKVIRFSFIKPRVIVSVPSGITEVEERAVIQAMMEAGARRVYLIEAPLAAGLGAQLDIDGANGCMVIDIGGGITDIAVLSMNGVAESSSVKIAGDAFDDAIVKYVRRQFGVVIGTNTAEEIKMTIGCVYPSNESYVMQTKGRDVKSGLAKELVIQSRDVMDAMLPVAKQIAEEVVNVLEQTSPELIADISENGIVLTGGASQIRGMDRLLAEVTQMPCIVADDAASCAAFGCGKSISWIRQMQDGTVNIARKKLLKD